MSLYSRLDRIAADVEKLNRQVNSVANSPQAQRTSIEAGTMDINDEDGNLISSVGFQEDGSGAVRFFDGPVPPVPSGVTASADGPIIQASWDGSFVDGLQATYDLAYLEVAATLVDDDSRVSFATITAKEGASATLVANQSGEWAVAVRSVSQAGKKSEFFSAGTVEVKLVDLAGAIEAVQDSANGKNKVTYSDRPPTPDDPGIFDDTWFVGQVGRPNDVVEATNVAINPSAEIGNDGYFASTAITINRFSTAGYQKFGSYGLTADVGAGASAFTYVRAPLVTLTAGAWTGSSLWMYGGTGSTWVQLRFLFYNQAGGSLGFHSVTPIQLLPGEWTQVAGAVQTPSGAVTAYPYFYIYNDAAGAAPVSGSRVRFDGWSVVSAGSQAEALAAVSTYFDGDTPSGETVNESHYRWTGTPHASTSEKYLPALDIGESSNWNIIEQYRHDGTGWVKVELSHMVFSTVDLGKATVGELDGIRIMGQTVRGEQLSGDAIDGKVITGGTYRTTDGTGQWSDAGLFIAQPDGTSMVRFPTDGSPLSLTASDVQIDRASITDLDLSYGAVRSGGALTLASGVTSPASPPELTTGWQRFTTLAAYTDAGHDSIGLAYWEDGAGNKYWVRAINVWGSAGDTNDAIELYDYVTGAYVRGFIIDINPRYDITVMGDIVYVFGAGHTGTSHLNYIDGYNLVTGARVSRHEYTRAIQAKNALGNDGTNLIVASVYNRRLWVHRRNPVTGAQVGTDMLSGENTWPTADASDLFGISVNSAGTEFTVVPTVATRVYSVSGGMLTHKPDTANANGLAGWDNPDRQAAGCAWVDSTPYPVDAAGNIYQGSNLQSDATFQLCYTWFDGTHETTPSPVAEILVPAQRTFITSLPARVGLQKKLYINIGGWGWAVVGEDQTSFAGINLEGSGPPPTTNSFPNAEPAVFRSTNGNIVMRGDGSGKWGPLTFNPDGTMSSSQIPAWVPLTGFLNQWAPHAGWFPPAYRVWPDGKVEYRGMMSKASGLPDDGQAVFTIPAEAMPTSTVSVPVATNTTSRATLLQLDFRPGPGDAAAWPPGRGTYDRVGLDGIYYYKN